MDVPLILASVALETSARSHSATFVFFGAFVVFGAFGAFVKLASEGDLVFVLATFFCLFALLGNLVLLGALEVLDFFAFFCFPDFVGDFAFVLLDLGFLFNSDGLWLGLAEASLTEVDVTDNAAALKLTFERTSTLLSDAKVSILSWNSWLESKLEITLIKLDAISSAFWHNAPVQGVVMVASNVTDMPSRRSCTCNRRFPSISSTSTSMPQTLLTMIASSAIVSARDCCSTAITSPNQVQTVQVKSHTVHWTLSIFKLQ